MIPVQRGCGGWADKPLNLTSAATVAMLAAALMLFGCSSKKPGAGANGGLGNVPGGMGESGMGPGGGNSLTKLQKGTLGEGDQGPLKDIHFGYNDYTIQPQDNDILRANADWLQQQENRNARVQVEGHCDERGSEEYNIALGAKRAQAAKEYLQTLGINADRISTISYGKELPLCTDHAEDCWSQNRRDHFAVQE
jgi:peptidoglycan-associated lipoprotein